MFQRVGASAFKKDLGNIRAICDLLGSPENKFKSIHIAGTNGKGSVTHMLASVFIAAGYRVGIYTSPHYRDFRERIKINNQLIPKKKVIDFVEGNQTIFDDIKPSFFEWTVALAFDYFSKEKVDIAIIETGLGGRLDSTNIIHPLQSIITNIGFDHTDMLGNSLPEIAFEKAGIIKSEIPVIIGESHPHTVNVFSDKAAAMGAPVIFADKIYSSKIIGMEEGNAKMEVCKNGKPIFANLSLQHAGKYQEENLTTTIAALENFNLQYPEWFPDLHTSIKKGLSNLRDLTHFIGRWEYISTEPRVLVDSAHNEPGISKLVESFKTLEYEKLHLVLGFVSDKNHDKVLELLPKNATYYWAKANIPRGLDATELKEKASKFDLNGKAYTSVRRALAAAKKRSKNDDLIFVGGSIFVVAEVI